VAGVVGVAVAAGAVAAAAAAVGSVAPAGVTNVCPADRSIASVRSGASVAPAVGVSLRDAPADGSTAGCVLVLTGAAAVNAGKLCAKALAFASTGVVGAMAVGATPVTAVGWLLLWVSPPVAFDAAVPVEACGTVVCACVTGGLAADRTDAAVESRAGRAVSLGCCGVPAVMDND
jgi:hypothetical protein